MHYAMAIIILDITNNMFVIAEIIIRNVSYNEENNS
jgi:hypothetical protein